MTAFNKTILCLIFCVLISAPGFVSAQEAEAEDTQAVAEMEVLSRGSIPEELLRPRRGESPRYAADTVIGPLGPGDVSMEAHQFARRVATALTAGNMDAPSLSAMNKVSLESLLSTLETINPRNCRLGGGREENDGAISFLVRFIGPEQAMTGELYIRDKAAKIPVEMNLIEEGVASDSLDDDGEEAPVPQTVQPVWVFEDLILEDAQNKDGTISEPRFDFSPYQRFF